MTTSVLANFIRFLEHHSLVAFDIDGEGKKRRSNRFKIQKYVFLANMFGAGLPYEHDTYLYGPYSSSLGEECRELARGQRERYERANHDGLPGSFDTHGFLDAVYAKDNWWLEVATCLIARNRLYTDREDLLENVLSFKGHYGRRFISNVLSDLEALGLVRLGLVT